MQSGNKHNGLKSAGENLNYGNTHLFLILLLIFFSNIILAQSDTLFFTEKKISCKIIEIGEKEIKYRLASVADGPLYVTNKKNIIKYKLSNGFEEKVVVDTLPIKVQQKEVIGNRSVIKLQFSHLFLGCISASYEKAIRMGINLELEAGLNNNSFYKNETLKSFGTYSDVGAPFGYCIYFKPGIKLLLGREFSNKRLRYAHPLKGRYLRFDIAVSYVKLKNLFRNTGYEYLGIPAPPPVFSDVTSVAYGVFVSYGRQFLISGSFTFDYYFGLGVAMQSNKYSNPAFVERSAYDDRARRISRYSGFTRDSYSGVSVTGGLKLGYILPSKKLVRLPKKNDIK